MKLSVNYKLAVLVAASGLMSGCTSLLSVGESDYACPGMPESSLCSSVVDVYSATNGNDYKGRIERLRNRNKKISEDVDDNSGLDDFDGDVVISTKESRSHKKEHKVEHGLKKNEVEVSFTPNDRTTPEVKKVIKKRVWIAPWISNSGVSYDEQLVYMKHNPAWKDQEFLTVDDEESKGNSSFSGRLFQPLVAKKMGNKPK